MKRRSALPDNQSIFMQTVRKSVEDVINENPANELKGCTTTGSRLVEKLEPLLGGQQVIDRSYNSAKSILDIVNTMQEGVISVYTGAHKFLLVVEPNKITPLQSFSGGTEIDFQFYMTGNSQHLQKMSESVKESVEKYGQWKGVSREAFTKSEEDLDKILREMCFLGESESSCWSISVMPPLKTSQEKRENNA